MAKEYKINLGVIAEEKEAVNDLMKQVPLIIKATEKQLKNQGIDIPINIDESKIKAQLSSTMAEINKMGSKFKGANLDLGSGIGLKISQKDNQLVGQLSTNYAKVYKEAKRLQDLQGGQWKEVLKQMTAQNPELQKMATYYRNLEKETAKASTETNKLNVAYEKTQDELTRLGLSAEHASDQINKTSNPKYRQRMEELSKEIAQMQAEFLKLASSTDRSEKELSQYSSRIKNATNEMNLLKQSAKSAGLAGMNAGELFKKGAKSFLIWQIVTNIWYGVTRAFGSGMESIVELDSAMTDLMKVTNESESAYRKFGDTAFEVADKLAGTAIDVTNATTAFARMGFGINEATKLAQDAIILQNVGDGIDSIEDSSGSLISTLKAFNMEASESTHLVDAMNEVSNKNAVTTGDLAEGMKRAGAVFAQSNTSFEEGLGLLTAGTEIIGSAEKVSTGLTTIGLRIRGVNEENEEIIGLVPELQKAFSNIGVQLTDTNGEFRSTYDILQDLSKVYPELDSVTQAYISETSSEYVQKCA